MGRNFDGELPPLQNAQKQGTRFMVSYFIIDVSPGNLPSEHSTVAKLELRLGSHPASTEGLTSKNSNRSGTYTNGFPIGPEVQNRFWLNHIS